MSLLELKENQEIIIDKVKYEVLNMIKFIEKSSYWVEYKLKNIEDGNFYYLEISLDSKAVLYEMIKNEKIDLKMIVDFQGEEYELCEKGTEKVETYYGMTDVYLKEEADYYEYVNKKDKKIFLSVEKWKNVTEISRGRKINLSDIRY